jgi:glycosyltransferase involved in cell wall biosynthesis
VIAWIPDLQHRALPQLFTRIAWMRRELGFRMQIWSGRFIMCSSFDTLREIKRLYPSIRHRASAIRFAIQPPISITDLDARVVAKKHNLPEKFFFMPNQFWAHKNHKIVIKALQLLAAKGHVLTILASGQQMDSRNINYAPKLLADIKASGLQEHFITPGLLPYEDLAPLMQACCALINPSLFEGWSTTVEEAKSAGVSMILSDIPVHREQAGENAVYFDPSSPEALANILISFTPLRVNKRKMQIKLAKDSAKIRVQSFALEFFGIIQKTMQRSLSS